MNGSGTGIADPSANGLAGGYTTGETYNIDQTKPTVAITAPAVNPVKEPFTATFTFSEDVLGFTTDDILAGPASVLVSDFTKVSDQVYTALITPTADGTVTVSVAADKAGDAAANGNQASNIVTKLYDGTRPTVAVTAPATNPVNTAFTATITFSEDVTDFTLAEIAVSPSTATASNLVKISNKVYTATITPTVNGTVTVSVAADVAFDAAANGNDASLPMSRIFDAVNPTVTITSTLTGPTNAASIPVTITFSKAVTGFTLADVVVAGGNKGSLSGSGDTYTFTITPTATGTITVNIAANVAQDGAGNGNLAASTWSLQYDGTRPTVLVSAPLTDPVIAPFLATFTFSEDVTGFTAADLTLTNATAVNFTQVSAQVFNALITPAANGNVTVMVGAAKANDAAANDNQASNTITRNFDGTRPTVTLSTVALDPTNANPILVTIKFSELVSGFDLTDVVVVGGTKGAFTVSGMDYSFTISPTGNGVITVAVAADVARDAATNGNTAATGLVINYDGTRPTVALSSPAPVLINTPFQVTFTFTEAVSGFAGNEITVVNGTASAFTPVSATEYTALITPAATGEVKVSLAANVAADAAANGNQASAAVLSRTFDNQAPAGYGVAFNQNRIDATNQASASVRVSGAEPGSAYFYTIKSNNGGTDVTGTANAVGAIFNIAPLNLSNLNDGLLTVSFYQRDAMGNTGAVVTATVTKIGKDIASVAVPAQIKVPFRTVYGQLPLPAQVEVTYQSGDKEMIAVTWLPGSFNGMLPGLYPLAGNLVLGPGMTNVSNRKAAIIVEVLPNLAPTALALSNATFAPDLNGTDNTSGTPEAFGTFSTTDPDDTQHTYTLAGGTGGTNNDLFDIIGDQLYLKSNRGLYGKRTFSIRVRTTDPYNNTFEQVFTINKGMYLKGNMEIVNAFSPNGDGVNDTWTIPELRFYNDVEIEVFDRAGVRMFHTLNPELGWDGRNPSGQEMKGPFLYILQIKDVNFVKKGVVTILKRN